MESFPEDFTFARCMKIIEENQRVMTNNVRKQFYDEIMKAVTDCAPFVKLSFPKNHWPIHKIQITSELLEIFKEIETITHNQKTNSTVSTPITDATNVSKSIDSLVIRFMLE
jgi:ABC-type transport system substrate-binding protein